MKTTIAIGRHTEEWETWETENGITCSEAFDRGYDAAADDETECPYGEATPKLRAAWADGWHQYQEEN